MPLCNSKKAMFRRPFSPLLKSKAPSSPAANACPAGFQTAKKMQKGRNTPFPHSSTVDFTMKKGVCQLFYANFFDDFADFSMISARFCDIMTLRIYFRVAFPPFRLSSAPSPEGCSAFVFPTIRSFVAGAPRPNRPRVRFPKFRVFRLRNANIALLPSAPFQNRNRRRKKSRRLFSLRSIPLPNRGKTA